MTTVCIPNTGAASLYDRVSRLLDTIEWCDCTFIVCNKPISAHRLILAISSPVFKAMLFGPLAESGDIIVDDVNPDIFQLLLGFLYKDMVVIDSLRDACELLYAAKKYMLKNLVDVCLKFIKKSVSLKNVFYVLSFVEWIQEEKLLNHCIMLICKHAECILVDDAEHITTTCLQMILQQNNINISERQMIEHSIKWAKDECNERNIKPTGENVRELLIEIESFQLLRFYTLPKDDIKWIRDLNILTADEKDAIVHSLQNRAPIAVQEAEENDLAKGVFCLETKSIKDFKMNYPINLTKELRVPMRIDWQFCYRSAIRSAPPLVIENNVRTITVRIKCVKTLFLHSVAIPSRQSDANHAGPNVYKEHIKLKISNVFGKVEKTTAVFKKSRAYNGVSYFDLPQRLLLLEDEWYALAFTWPSLKSSQQYKYTLSYRPTTSSDNNFLFDDNYDMTLPCGAFIEGLKVYI